MSRVYKSRIFKFNYKKFLVVLFFIFALIFFIAQTKKAMTVVNFHAEIFERRETVIIDAGHGGEDGGTVGVNNIMEKDINLAIAQELEKILINQNFNVIMIRDGDYSVGDQSLSTVAQRKSSDIKERLNVINETGECIFISIHQNHFSDSSVHGTQVFYSGNREESKLLAESIKASVANSVQPDNKRECKLADSSIYILYNCDVPAVLVECGFISNLEEASLLSDKDYQKDMAQAIYDGLKLYLASNSNNIEDEISGKD